MSLCPSGLWCDVCGDLMLAEMLVNKPVEQFKVKGCDTMLHCHDKCKKAIKSCDGDWRKLPDGPLKKAYQKCQKEIDSEKSGGSTK